MKKIAHTLMAILLVAALAAPAPASGPGPGISADEALKMLQDGNARFTAGKPKHPHQDRERRVSTATKGQQPFAAVLACADSRSPVEFLFDQGLGDVFVVRVAGNVAGADEIGSLEYAAEHLNTPLLVVLGHSKCGAVTAVVEDAKLHGHLPSLASKIKPGVSQARAEHRELKGAELVEEAVKANVRRAQEDLLRQSQGIKKLVKENKLQVMGAVYDLESGQVAWMGAHPQQDKILGAPMRPAAHSKKEKPTSY